MADETTRVVVQRVDEVYTKEALQANDGKVIPLRDRPGGEIIGEATLHFDEDAAAVTASLKIDDPVVEEMLSGSLPPLFRGDPKGLFDA